MFIVYKMGDKYDRKRRMQIWYKEDVELIFRNIKANGNIINLFN